MPILEIKNITKSYASSGNSRVQTKILDNVSFEMSHGSIIALLGPSGCGKTTLLRIIAGLEKADFGSVLFDSKDMEKVAPYKRRFGMMFQDFALFPHKTVYENVAFGVQFQNSSQTDFPLNRNYAKKILNLVGLSDFSERSVNALSGGEKQRVALARSLASNPRLLMLDEPLGSLDRALREVLVEELHYILKSLQMTTILVTHDQAEAFAIADSIIILNQGKIEQIDIPEKLYEKPLNKHVAKFLGFKNLLSGSISKSGHIITKIGVIPKAHQLAPETKVTVLIRPEAAKLRSTSSTTENRCLEITGSIVARIFQGDKYKITLKLNNGAELTFDISNEVIPPGIGQKTELQLNLSGIELIEANVD